jgi:hypothetical protein
MDEPNSGVGPFLVSAADADQLDIPYALDRELQRLQTIDQALRRR